jgi:hypothetical protein
VWAVAKSCWKRKDRSSPVSCGKNCKCYSRIPTRTVSTYKFGPTIRLAFTAHHTPTFKSRKRISCIKCKLTRLQLRQSLSNFTFHTRFVHENTLFNSTPNHAHAHAHTHTPNNNQYLTRAWHCSTVVCVHFCASYDWYNSVWSEKWQLRVNYVSECTLSHNIHNLFDIPMTSIMQIEVLLISFSTLSIICKQLSTGEWICGPQIKNSSVYWAQQTPSIYSIHNGQKQLY